MTPADLNLASEVTGYQRFLFISLPARLADRELAMAVDHLGEGMENMHEVEGTPSQEAFQRGRYQYLRAEKTLSQERDLPHKGISKAQALIRLEAASAEPFLHYEAGLRMRVEDRGGTVEAVGGVQRGRSYTSHATYQFSNAPALLPGSGSRFPLGVVTPLSKTKAWWEMDWMHRESFFLPRYNSEEKQVAKGHTLAAAAGIPVLVRRLVHAPDSYGREGHYDFLGYFEFAEEHAPIFREVMAALRNVQENPEWNYVREGPEWWGRRVGRAAQLWEDRSSIKA